VRIAMSSVCAVAVALALLTGTAAADQIGDIINQASIAEFQSYERVLSGVDPVPGDPPVYLTNRYSLGPLAPVAAQWITDQFTSWGLNATQEGWHTFHGPNVVADLPGTTRPDDIYIICGHYDTWHEMDQTHAPGCDDNGSGTSAVLTAAHILSQYQFEGTLRFIAFSGEEEGLLGSAAYVGTHYGENFVATINLDMFLHPGWDNVDPDPDYDLDIGVNGPSTWLGQYVFDKFTQYTSIDVELWNDTYGNSDHGSFWAYDYSAIRFAEHTTPENWYEHTNDAYHQITDTFDNPDYDWDFAVQTVRGGMAGLAGLAGLVPEPNTAATVGLLVLLAGRRRRN
jgi:hypothetical protein